MKQRKYEFYLFQLFGFKVSIDWTWFLFAFLIIWTLAYGYFPIIVKGLNIFQYLLMACVGAFGLFASIVVHELCHSLVGRMYNMPIRGIKLFIFGGIAELAGEPPNPKAEFLMSIAGPIASAVLGCLFGLIYYFGTSLAFNTALNSIFGYLSFINFALAIFNMLPGFPLDGGRVLRAALWWWKGDLRKSTEIATKIGISLGIALIIFGALNILLIGNIVGGIWVGIIGFFLQYISRFSMRQTIIKLTFENEYIRDYARKDVITVTPNLSIQQLIKSYFFNYYYKFYPVVVNNELLGIVSLEEVQNISKEKYFDIFVSDIMQKCSEENTIDADTKINDVLDIMNTKGRNYLMIVEGHTFFGIITSKDLMDVIERICKLSCVNASSQFL